MRKQIIIGNWKMNGSIASIKSLCNALNLEAKSKHADAVVCVPNIYLSYVADSLNANIGIGVQNASQYDNGAVTGEISTQMLQDFDCKYVIVGHSERRQLFNETSEEVAAKAKKIAQAQMYPIACVGETLAERQSGCLEQVLTAQLSTVLNALTLTEAQKLILAYEPVWAIGTGLAATAEQVQEVHHFLRKIVSKFNEELAKNIKIIYGGSLKPSNANELLSLNDVDGGLIGGASLNGKDFGQIIKQAKQTQCSHSL